MTFVHFTLGVRFADRHPHIANGGAREWIIFVFECVWYIARFKTGYRRVDKNGFLWGSHFMGFVEQKKIGVGWLECNTFIAQHNICAELKWAPGCGKWLFGVWECVFAVSRIEIYIVLMHPYNVDRTRRRVFDLGGKTSVQKGSE